MPCLFLQCVDTIQRLKEGERSNRFQHLLRMNLGPALPYETGEKHIHTTVMRVGNIYEEGEKASR